MTVTITKTLFDEMTAHAKSRLPEEACGLIAGVRKENLKFFLTKSGVKITIR